MEITGPNMKWIDWFNEHLNKLNIKNSKEELLSHVSFKAGYRQAIIDAGRWWYEYLSKSELCEMERYGSDDEVVMKFFRDMEE